MEKLNEQQLETALKNLPQWRLEADGFVKEFRFADFVQSMVFVNKVAGLAEAAGHHPDIDIRYNRVRTALTTHDSGGVTQKDVDLAQQLDHIL